MGELEGPAPGVFVPPAADEGVEGTNAELPVFNFLLSRLRSRADRAAPSGPPDSRGGSGDSAISVLILGVNLVLG